MNRTTAKVNCSQVNNIVCMTDEDYDEYLDAIYAYIFPKWEWAYIIINIIILFVGLSGNSLVTWIVLTKRYMRSVTNYFIVNLAVGDLLVLVICLIPSILEDAFRTWFLGVAMCKIVKYLGAVTVSISVLTLTAIAVERVVAIVWPFVLRKVNLRFMSLLIIVLIWLVSLTMPIIELITLDVKQPFPNTVYLSTCHGAPEVEKPFQISLMVLLYFTPLGVITLCYILIAHTLLRRPQVTNTTALLNGDKDKTRQNEALLKRPPDDLMHSTESLTAGARRFSSPVKQGDGRTTVGLKPLLSSGNYNNASAIEQQYQSRQKVIKMLVVVVALFFLCYLPVYLLNILWYAHVINVNSDRTMTSLLSITSHTLVYINSACNPIIYNFMSTKFRKEFRQIVCCRAAQEPVLPANLVSMSRSARATPMSLHKRSHNATPNFASNRYNTNSPRMGNRPAIRVKAFSSKELLNV